MTDATDTPPVANRTRNRGLHLGPGRPPATTGPGPASKRARVDPGPADPAEARPKWISWVAETALGKSERQSAWEGTEVRHDIFGPCVLAGSESNGKTLLLEFVIDGKPVTKSITAGHVLAKTPERAAPVALSQPAAGSRPPQGAAVTGPVELPMQHDPMEHDMIEMGDLAPLHGGVEDEGEAAVQNELQAALAGLRHQYEVHMEHLRQRVKKPKSGESSDAAEGAAGTMPPPAPPADPAPETVVLTDEMCYVAFRINNDDGEYDVRQAGGRATEIAEGPDAKGRVELLVAECFRRELGEARNWTRKQAVAALAKSKLGFKWDDTDGAAAGANGSQVCTRARRHVGACAGGSVGAQVGR